MASGDNRQGPSKPAFGEEEAAELVHRVFGLRVTRVQPLPSYDDQNFHVSVPRGSGEAEGADEYVLKITNSEDSREPDLIEAQTRAMVFLSAEGFPAATPHLTKDGNIMSLEAGGSAPGNKKYMVRLLTYLPGIPVAKIAATTQVLYEIGKLAASLDKALTEKFHHPSIKSLHRGPFIWNLANVPLLDQYVCALGQDKHREAVERVIQHFKEKVTPNLSSFRACINHGDLNDHNVLAPGGFRLSGVLDFSDMSYGCYVFEAAIAIAYLMIESAEPLRVGGHVLAGFESIVPLRPEERAALFPLVCGRLCQSLVMAAHTARLYPDNEEYLMITARTGWRHLLALSELGQEAAEQTWFETARAY
ncbi:HYKK kinase, partial [Penelope pileata]|nr:HYKK kinase [Penelope pileata]